MILLSEDWKVNGIGVESRLRLGILFEPTTVRSQSIVAATSVPLDATDSNKPFMSTFDLHLNLKVLMQHLVWI